MNRYKKYKDSGVEWIGDIPCHWKIIRVKHLVNKSKYYQIGDGDHGSIKPEMYLDEGVPYIRVQNLTWNGQIDKNGLVYISEETHSKNPKSKILSGDILIAKTGATIGKLGLVDDKIGESNTTSSVGKITIDTNYHNTKFYLFNFQVDYFQKNLWQIGIQKSAQPGFNIDDLVDFQIISPPLTEQEQIVSYLDEKTSQIDKMIQITETKIDLLKQKRVSLINDAVTKGLDKTVKMKDSGVEWIGEIPRHWVMIKLKCISYINNGSTPNSGISEFWDGDIVWVTPSDISRLKNRIIQNSERKITPSGLNSCGTNIVPPNSVILTTRAPIGNIGISSIELCTNQGCKSIVTKDINPVLLYYFLLISKEELQALGSGTTFLELSTESLKNFQVVLPPLSEQEQIVSYIDEKTSQIDQLVSIEQKRIETLKEYRQSLISEVVTGKVKVCDNEVV
jgi:type I restriction enzyme S subunit